MVEGVHNPKDGYCQKTPQTDAGYQVAMPTKPSTRLQLNKPAK